ncbi:hypothetical protein [Granulicella sp. dw_53]|uniref:hypothetical protein n=1 Tax=Granulicella sp. dw_53 TaxID=2719792 RepID=UPI001BD1CB63|nr:hypothetical protein [Granulicella sp. dw_53]
MALTPSNVDATTDSPANAAEPAKAASIAPDTAGTLLIGLTSLPPEALEATLTNLALAFSAPTSGQSGNRNILVTTPDAGNPILTGGSFGNLRLIPYTAATPAVGALYLTAADYLNTFKVAQEHKVTACILLGPESQSLTPVSIRALASALMDPTGKAPTDLAVPRYNLGPHEGLVNSAILYPVTRTLYGAQPRYPLAIDLGLSLRMAERLAAIAQTFTAAGQNDAILWPVAEAAAANFVITEVDSGPRSLPQPASIDLNALLAQVAGSFFNDINLKASFWQRVRTIQPLREVSMLRAPAEGWPDVTPMLAAFQLAYTNLHEIWALVLPPNSLLGLKRLSQMPVTSFRMSDALWIRIVYDFVLAHRLRTINRGHLLGALTPLYLAWVASHIILAESGTAPEQHIEELATNFENDKAYLVSRWRWPDRFNP